MAIAFKCNSCEKALRVNDEYAGKKIKCPGCGTVVSIPAAGASSAAAATPAPRPAAKTTPAAVAPPTPPAATGGVVSCECGTKIKTKPEWAGKTIKCPKCEAKIKVPGGAAPAPAPVAPARPAPKKPAPPPVEESFEDGGFGSPADDAEGFGGGGFSGGGFNDDGGADEEPVTTPARRQPPAPPAKKKSRVGLLLGLIVGAAVLVGGGYFGLQYYDNMMKVDTGPIKTAKNDKVDPKATDKVDEDDNPPDNPPEKTPENKTPEVKNPEPPVKKTPAAAGSAFDLVVADSVAFVNVKPKGFLKTAIAQKFMGGAVDDPMFKEVTERLGVGPDDIVDVIISTSEIPPPDAPPPTGIAILTTSKAINADAFDMEFQGKKFQKKESGGVYYTLDLGPKEVAFMPAGDKTLVVGLETDILKHLTTRGDKPGPLAMALKSAAAGKHHVFAAVHFPETFLDSVIKKGGTEEIAGPFSEVKSAWIAISGDKALTLNAKLNFDDPAKAAKAKETLDGLIKFAAVGASEMNKAPGFEKIAGLADGAIKSAKTSASGDSLELAVTVNASLDDLGMLILPILDKVQGSAKQTISLNNLKQLGLAMHGYHDSYRKFPDSPFNGGLSWRVAVLPFVEAKALLDGFKLDEPWDSDYNKQFIEQMPKVFEHPSRPAPPGHTYYRIFVGPKTIWEEAKGTNLNKITDGSSNTLLIVEAADAVPWTKPEEIVFDPEGALPKLGENGRFSATFADGSARTFVNVDPKTLQGLITANGGEVLNLFGDDAPQPPKLELESKKEIDLPEGKKAAPIPEKKKAFDPLAPPDLKGGLPGLKLGPPSLDPLPEPKKEIEEKKETPDFKEADPKDPLPKNDLPELKLPEPKKEPAPEQVRIAEPRAIELARITASAPRRWVY